MHTFSNELHCMSELLLLLNQSWLSSARGVIEEELWKEQNIIVLIQWDNPTSRGSENKLSSPVGWHVYVAIWRPVGNGLFKRSLYARETQLSGSLLALCHWSNPFASGSACNRGVLFKHINDTFVILGLWVKDGQSWVFSAVQQRRKACNLVILWLKNLTKKGDCVMHYGIALNPNNVTYIHCKGLIKQTRRGWISSCWRCCRCGCGSGCRRGCSNGCGSFAAWVEQSDVLQTAVAIVPIDTTVLDKASCCWLF